MEFEIKEIASEDTFDVRREVLSPYQTIKEFQYDGDDDRNSFHLGAFHNGELVSVASFYNEKSKFFEEENQYRLRAMATVKKYRGKQAGSKLMTHAEKILKKRYARLLWCYVSSPMSNYYTQFGFLEYGKVFVIESIGPHKVMYKMM